MDDASASADAAVGKLDVERHAGATVAAARNGTPVESRTKESRAPARPGRKGGQQAAARSSLASR